MGRVAWPCLEVSRRHPASGHRFHAGVRGNPWPRMFRRGCKPNSVFPAGAGEKAISLSGRYPAPVRRSGHGTGRSMGALFGLAPGEVFHAPTLTRRAVGSYPAFSPLPRPLRAAAVSFLWHCLSRHPFGRRSRVYPRPCRGYAAPCPVEFGLSSRGDATSDLPPLRNRDRLPGSEAIPRGFFVP